MLITNFTEYIAGMSLTRKGFVVKKNTDNKKSLYQEAFIPPDISKKWEHWEGQNSQIKEARIRETEIRRGRMNLKETVMPAHKSRKNDTTKERRKDCPPLNHMCSKTII